MVTIGEKIVDEIFMKRGREMKRNERKKRKKGIEMEKNSKAKREREREKLV